MIDCCHNTAGLRPALSLGEKFICWTVQMHITCIQLQQDLVPLCTVLLSTFIHWQYNAVGGSSADLVDIPVVMCAYVDVLDLFAVDHQRKTKYSNFTNYEQIQTLRTSSNQQVLVLELFTIRWFRNCSLRTLQHACKTLGLVAHD